VGQGEAGAKRRQSQLRRRLVAIRNGRQHAPQRAQISDPQDEGITEVPPPDSRHGVGRLWRAKMGEVFNLSPPKVLNYRWLHQQVNFLYKIAVET
jgi:hypothetical protein